MIEHGHTVCVVYVEAIDDRAANDSVRCEHDVYEGVAVERLYLNLEVTPDPLAWSFEHPGIANYFAARLAREKFDLLYLVSGYLIEVAQKFHLPTIVMLTDFWFLCPTLQLVRGDGSLCRGPEPIECARCLYDQQRRYRLLDERAPGVMKFFWRAMQRVPILGTRLGLPARLHTLEQRQARLLASLNSADAVISPTRFVASMHATNGVKAKRLAYICSPVASLKIPDAPVYSPESLVRIGYLGQMVPIKGVHLLVQAFHRLEQSKRRAQLVLHGNLEAQPRYAEHLRRLAENDLAIVFAGRYPHADPGKILSEVDVVVVPSTWYENAPQVILEAFAAKKPVIGANVGGIAEVIQSEVNGLLFQVNNANDLACQLQWVLDEPGLLLRLQQGILPVRTIDQEMTELFQVFEQVAAKQTVLAEAMP